jgi:hypothetical protein
VTILGNNTISTGTVGSTSTALAAANRARKHLTITNLSDEKVFLSEGAAAEANKGICLAPVDASGNPVAAGRYATGENGLLFLGAVNGICASGSKSVAIKES